MAAKVKEGDFIPVPHSKDSTEPLWAIRRGPMVYILQDAQKHGQMNIGTSIMGIATNSCYSFVASARVRSHIGTESRSRTNDGSLHSRIMLFKRSYVLSVVIDNKPSTKGVTWGPFYD